MKTLPSQGRRLLKLEFRGNVKDSGVLLETVDPSSIYVPLIGARMTLE